MQKENTLNNEIQNRIDAAKTSVVKAIFPSNTNHYDTMFGGAALQIMDEVAFICATRFCRKKVVTVSSDKVDFTKPIPAGTIAEFVASVEKVGNTSIKIRVDIYVEQMYSDFREKAISGVFTLVAVNDLKHPVPLLDNI